tara:strand:- start:5790 stop:6026 length:237 start_codon:yes stop_codon:yes gene_type:complete
MNKKKRYVVQMEMYVYADNDYMARKRSHNMRQELDNKYPNARTAVTELGEQPFASLNYRKIDDHSEPLSKEELSDLPF